jgi:hypothetical protein
VVRPRRISDFKPLFTNLAQTSHFQVIFGGLPGQLLAYLYLRGVEPRFIAENAGLLCFSASLPGSSFATADVNNNFTGVNERVAHRRIFTEIGLEFYVDRDYRTLKFIEHWMEFISGGSNADPYREGYYFRMQYPEAYKSNTTKIIKFDRDYNREIEYNFFGLFPLALNSTPVSYNGSDVLRISATFNYERYVCGKVLSLDVARNVNNNIIPNVASVSNTTNQLSRLATGKTELINRNLNLGTGRLDDPRPIGIGGVINGVSNVAYDRTRRVV